MGSNRTVKWEAGGEIVETEEDSMWRPGRLVIQMLFSAETSGK